MNILVICKRYYTNKDLILDRFGRLYHFPVEWKKNGHNVTVIALNYHNKDLIHENIEGVNFYSVPFSIARLLSTYKLVRMLGKSDFDVVFASADQIAGFIGLRISIKLKKPIVFDVYDDYRAFGISKIPGMKSLFYYVIRKVDFLSCISKSLLRDLVIFNNNSAVFPNGTDTSIFYRRDKTKVRSRLGFNDSSILIGYTGSMDKRFDFDTLAKAFAIIKSIFSNASLLIAGRNINNLDLKIEGVKYFGEISQSKVPEIISACDVMVMPYSDHLLAKTCNPCKLTEYIACDVPIVSSSSVDVDEYLGHTEYSVYECGSFEDLAKKIILQIRQPEIAPIKKGFAWEVIAKEILDVFKALIS